MDKHIFLSRMHKQVSDPNIRASQKALERIKYILEILHMPQIKTPSLQAVCFQGIPDGCRGLRSLCWKVLVGYLPETTSKWQDNLNTYRKNYAQFIEDYYVPLTGALDYKAAQKKALKLAKQQAKALAEEKKENGVHNEQGNITDKLGQFSIGDASPKIEDDGTNKIYPGFAQDEALWEDVVKDTKRTRSEMDFFQRETKQAKENNGVTTENGQNETHNDILARILFIYAKLNPGVSYVQGMNEIVAPIYYCFCDDDDPSFAGHAEADTFFCFSLVMGEIQDTFIKGLDFTEVGIQARILELNEMLKSIDKQVWEHLERYSVNPQFYTLRWLMLLLTQEFEISDVLRLWDSLLSHPFKLVYLNYLCLAMVLRIRNKILAADDFADLIEMLQKETSDDLDEIMTFAGKLYKKHAKPEERVYHIAFS